MTECPKTRAICAGLVELGAVVKVLAGSAVSSGLPDRLIAHRRWCGLVEFKDATTPVRTNQKLTIESLADRDFPVALVRFEAGGAAICYYFRGLSLSAWTDGTAIGLLEGLEACKSRVSAAEPGILGVKSSRTY